MTLKGKVSIVTGAARGIGRAIAMALGENGASVVVNDVSHAAEAEKVVAEIKRKGQEAFFYQADVADRIQDQQMVQAAVETFGRLDILINNAAVSVRKPLLDLEVEDVKRTWDVCLWGVFHCSQLAARQMAKQQTGGNIVMISSVHAFQAYPDSTAYNGAKAAINHMSLTWAAELAPYKIRVNVIEPGWVDTPGERQFCTEEQLREEGRKLLMGRLARPEEIARGVLFLVSEEDASYITGSCLRIDGGFVLPR